MCIRCAHTHTHTEPCWFSPLECIPSGCVGVLGTMPAPKILASGKSNYLERASLSFGAVRTRLPANRQGLLCTHALVPSEGNKVWFSVYALFFLPWVLCSPSQVYMQVKKKPTRPSAKKKEGGGISAYIIHCENCSCLPTVASCFLNSSYWTWRKILIFS